MLEDRCLAYAKANKHPEMRDRAIWEVFEVERPSLVPYVGPFDGFHAVPASDSKTCLVRFDNNRYSVDARAAGRPVEIRACADRLECWQDGQIVGSRTRAFGRGKTIYVPRVTYLFWHANLGLCATARPSRNGSCRFRSDAYSASWSANLVVIARWSTS